MTASVKAARLMLHGEAMDPDASAALRTQLLEYRAMDTLDAWLDPPAHNYACRTPLNLGNVADSRRSGRP